VALEALEVPAGHAKHDTFKEVTLLKRPGVHALQKEEPSLSE
jgi:hypothetical protein